MIFLTKSPGSTKSFQEAPRKLQKNSGQKSRNNFVGIFVETIIHQKDILKLSDLYIVHLKYRSKQFSKGNAKYILSSQFIFDHYFLNDIPGITHITVTCSKKTY